MILRQEQRFTVHLRTLSTGEPHFDAESPLLQFSIKNLDPCERKCSAEARVFGDYLGVRVTHHGEPFSGSYEHLVLWNWKSSVEISVSDNGIGFIGKHVTFESLVSR